MSFDVLVIDAGPAGATTALALARAGVRVLLVGEEPSDEAYAVLSSGPALAGWRSLGLPVDSWVTAVDTMLRFAAKPDRAITGIGAGVCDRSCSVSRPGPRRSWAPSTRT